ncbi:MAG: YbaB/EbfC family nucleoid-associated protein [Planctomycetaceae bacterium]|jgi:DNA-binding YbaB/EbfC family protein|nr:YbaB/EbfC family nucleoid-associated protein [Planctomycetaceae bacterium]
MRLLYNVSGKATLNYSKMFGKIFELGSLVKQANEFGGKMREMSEKLKDVRVEGSAAGGLVTVTVNGLQEVVSCKIDPAVFQQGDAELLEELVVDAVNDAVEESRSKQAESMHGLTEGIDISSLTETLGKIMPK